MKEVSTLNSNVTRLKFSIEFSPSFSTSQDYALTRYLEKQDIIRGFIAVGFVGKIASLSEYLNLWPPQKLCSHGATANHQTLKQKLKAIGSTGQIYRRLEIYLEDRQHFTEITKYVLGNLRCCE